MGAVLYKPLFEVRILHDYFLSKPDLTSIYVLNQNDKIAFLDQRISLDQYDVRSFLEIIPSATTRSIMKNFHLHLSMLPSGFVAGIKVKQQLNGAGEEEYTPTLAFSDALQLGFRLKFKKANFNSYTNLKIQQPAPRHFYFSNNNDDGVKIFPSLSMPVSNFQTGKTYETGELAMIGGQLKEAKEETSSPGASFWNLVKGTGFANEQDKLLLPKLFSYTMPEAMAAVEFRLKTIDGTVVKKLEANNVQAFQTLYLNFQQTIPAIDESPEDIADGMYLFEISGDTSTIFTPIFLADELYQSADIGSLVIDTNVTDPAFRVMNPNGTLITRKKTDGTFVPHPVYEIRFKRRSVYWRYRSNSGKPLKTIGNTSHFLNKDSGNLISKNLRPLSYYPTFFEDPVIPAIPKIHLPTPRIGSISKDHKRLFSDIYVSPIKGLIDIE